MKTIFCLTTLFLTAGSITCLAQSGSLSLAEIARQNQPNRKAVKIFTDENTPRPAPPVEDRKAVPTETASDQKKDARSISPNPKDSARVTELQKMLDSLKQNQAGWSRSAKDYENKLTNETSDFTRQACLETLASARENVESYQSQINDAQAALSQARAAAASSQSGGVKTQASARISGP